MAFLFKHSAIGTLIHFISTGSFSFSRQNINKLSSAFSSGEDLTVPIENPPADSTSINGEKQPDPDPEQLRRDKHLVTWDGPDDPDNPLNWPLYQKVLATTLLSVYTFAVYVGSSLYTSSQEDVMRIFGVSHVESALGLALYVLGYGMGCLLFSPISEIPAIGRNPPYAVSGFFFVILCIPTALVDNFAGLMVLRFLLGFMCSPCLATAGASFADIWAPAQFPYAIALWAAVASMSPTLGPLISSFAVEDLGWRFSSWELLIISGPIYTLILFLLPETSGLTILYYRAKRLREHTGNTKLQSEAEMKQHNIAVGSLLWDALIKPWEMNIKDPALLFTTLYMGLLYGIFYSFFESLPLVYPVYYGFSATSTALVFLAVLPAVLLAFMAHCLYLNMRVVPRLMNGTFGELENHLIPGLLASPLLPIGLFIFAWTARPSIHWIAPTIGLAITIMGIYFLAQSIFMYIPIIYPRYAASIFAANSLSRSLLAFTAILVARPMFVGIGVDGGVSLLGGLMVVCMIGMGLLYLFGKKLRERSRFAVG